MVFGASCIIRVLGICLSPCYERLPLLAGSNGFAWHRTPPVCIYRGAHFDRVAAVAESMRWTRQLLGVQRRKSASVSHPQRNIKAPCRADITVRQCCDNKSTCITIRSLLSTFCLCAGGCLVSVQCERCNTGFVKKSYFTNVFLLETVNKGLNTCCSNVDVSFSVCVLAYREQERP